MSRPLVFVVGRYPLVTTTFIDREITALRARGAAVDVLAVRRPPADMPLSPEQRALGRTVRYLLPARVAGLAAAHLRYAVTRPRVYFGTLGWLVTRRHPSGSARLKTVLHFGEGVLAAGTLRAARPRELYAHFADRAAVIALVASRLLGVPYSLSIHAGADVYVHPVLLREKVDEARCVVTCTAATRAHLAALVGDELGAKVRPMLHGLDITGYTPSHDQRCAAPRLLSVGQLREKKGLDVLVDACAALRDRGVPVACRIVGEGPQRAALEARISDAALDDVVLCGALSHDAVVDEYAAADVFVLPCVRTPDGHMDGIPNVVPEAMAMQLSVVSSDLPAIRELVTDGSDGILVPPGDATALADAIERVVTDGALRARLGTQARRTVVERFDVEANVGRLATELWPGLTRARVGAAS